MGIEALEKHQAELLRDRQFDVVALRQLQRGLRCINALGDGVRRCQDVLQFFAGRESAAKLLVAAEWAGAGGDEVANARQPDEGQGVRARRDAQARDLRQGAGDVGRFRVIAVVHPIADTCTDSDNIFQRASQFYADHVAIARAQRLEVHPWNDLGEFRVGEWEGRGFDELERDENWRRFNVFRSAVRPPGGETMLEVQNRMMSALECFGRLHPNQRVAVVSHADPLRSVLAHFLGVSLDLALRLEISPASVSVVEWNDWAPRVLCVNETGEVPS
jgi:broad specificity phosphatase PhoE